MTDKAKKYLSDIAKAIALIESSRRFMRQQYLHFKLRE
jgi:hypothetical protein